MRCFRSYDPARWIERDADLGACPRQGIIRRGELLSLGAPILLGKMLIHVFAFRRGVVVQEEGLPVDLHLDAALCSCLLKVAFADITPRSDGIGDEHDAQRSLQGCHR